MSAGSSEQGLSSLTLLSTPYILNGCPVALNQSRYTWRHDSILKKFVVFVRPQLSEDEHLYTDLPDRRALYQTMTAFAVMCVTDQ